MAMDTKPKMDIGLDMPKNSGPSKDKETKSKGKGNKIFITTFILLVLLVVAGFLVDKYTPVSLFGEMNLGNQVQSDYQAVFLTNGQVYFGKIIKTDDDQTSMQDIYYLQVASPLQQVPPPGTDTQPQLTLVKLGNELHGPTDYMKINNDHIVFTEVLREDGRVVEAIMQYKADNEQ